MKRETTPMKSRPTAVRKGTGRSPLASQSELKPTTDDVRRRAYEIYLQRMHTGEPGSPETDWSRAERELA